MGYEKCRWCGKMHTVYGQDICRRQKEQEEQLKAAKEEQKKVDTSE